MARYGIVARAEIAREVVFSGTPSQVVNLPAFIKWIVVAALIVGAYVFALNRWPVPWFAPAIALLLVGLGVLLVYLQTAFTEIIIDTLMPFGSGGPQSCPPPRREGGVHSISAIKRLSESGPERAKLSLMRGAVRRYLTIRCTVANTQLAAFLWQS